MTVKVTTARDPDAPLSPAEVDALVEALVSRIGERIREFRLMQGLTLPGLMEEHRINPGQLSRLENGHQNLTAKVVVRVAHALGVEPHDLYVPRELSNAQPQRRKRKPLTGAALDKAVKAFRKRIGRRVRELRQLQGMSLTQLEAWSGLALTQLQTIEKGELEIRASIAVRLADAIGVYPHELFIPAEQSGIRPRTPGGRR